MNSISRRGLAAIICGTVAGAGAYVPAPAQAATAPSEVQVVPRDVRPEFQPDQPAFAGTTGFLHQRDAQSPWLWTRYSDGRTTTVDVLNGVPAADFNPAGDDQIAFASPLPGHPQTDTSRSLLDLSTGVLRDVKFPANGEVRIYGDYLLQRAGNSDVALEVRDIDADVSSPGRPITGLPEGTRSVLIYGGDAAGAFLIITGPGGRDYALLDFASGQVSLLPHGLPTANKIVLTKDRVTLLSPNDAKMFSRAAVLSGDPGTPDTFALPGVNLDQVAVAGRDLIMTSEHDLGSAYRYTQNGAEPTRIAKFANTAVVQGPDAALFVGGDSAADWGVRKAGASGEPVVLNLANSLVNAGVTLSSGMLRHYQAQTLGGQSPSYYLFSHQLASGADVPAPSTTGRLLNKPVTCESDAKCIRAVDGLEYGPSFLVNWNTATALDNNGGLAVLPSTGGRVVDASRNYVVVNGTHPDQTFVTDANKVIANTPVTGSALWFQTLWSATAAGTLTPKNLVNSTTGTAVPTGSDCTATEVQATAKHLYWTCGANGPAGVYDLTAKKNITVPAGQFQLGDNYLVRHDADGDLLRYDLTDGTLGDAVKLATLPRGELADDRNITWSVDKFGGDVAWVDAQADVHIVDPGVTPSAPALSSPVGDSTLDLTKAATWSTGGYLTRPIDSSKLTITQVRTGKVVVTSTGGAARVRVAAGWNGLIDGKRATSGNYQWTLSATVGGTTSTIGSGTIAVACGTPTLHNYTCDGRPTILGMLKTPANTGEWLAPKGSSAPLLPTGITESWPAGTGLVPFGDISKDYYNDLLVRQSDGTMRVYLGTGSASFSSSKSLAIAGNWSSFNAFVHTGDVTGDGQSDLITRNRDTGSLYIYPGNGKGGFNAAVQIAGGYKGYTAFVGAGDISGDGKADLLLRYNDNLYGFYGAGDGTFASGLHLISAGWDAYSTIIGAGDLNEDGKNDLLARDANGTLYRMLGNGTGGFAARSSINLGFDKYSYLS